MAKQIEVIKSPRTTTIPTTKISLASENNLENSGK
jgi:hypothetical protein